MLKSVIALSAVLGLAAPAFANSAQADLGGSRPNASAMKKKKVEKKEEKKEETGGAGTETTEKKEEKTEETKPQG